MSKDYMCLWQNRNWRIGVFRGRMMVDDHWISQWPIKYDNGRIAWDFPERIPKYVKSLTMKLWKEG